MLGTGLQGWLRYKKTDTSKLTCMPPSPSLETNGDLYLYICTQWFSERVRWWKSVLPENVMRESKQWNEWFPAIHLPATIRGLSIPRFPWTPCIVVAAPALKPLHLGCCAHKPMSLGGCAFTPLLRRRTLVAFRLHDHPATYKRKVGICVPLITPVISKTCSRVNMPFQKKMCRNPKIGPHIFENISKN